MKKAETIYRPLFWPVLIVFSSFRNFFSEKNCWYQLNNWKKIIPVNQLIPFPLISDVKYWETEILRQTNEVLITLISRKHGFSMQV
jgi:hypothetical protein